MTHELNESGETLRRLRDEIDRLTQEIKEANLQSLSIAPADDLKVLLEGTPTPLRQQNRFALFLQLKRPLTTRPVAGLCLGSTTKKKDVAFDQSRIQRPHGEQRFTRSAAQNGPAQCLRS